MMFYYKGKSSGLGTTPPGWTLGGKIPYSRWTVRKWQKMRVYCTNRIQKDGSFLNTKAEKESLLYKQNTEGWEFPEHKGRKWEFTEQTEYRRTGVSWIQRQKMRVYCTNRIQKDWSFLNTKAENESLLYKQNTEGWGFPEYKGRLGEFTVQTDYRRIEVSGTLKHKMRVYCTNRIQKDWSFRNTKAENEILLYKQYTEGW